MRVITELLSVRVLKHDSCRHVQLTYCLGGEQEPDCGQLPGDLAASPHSAPHQQTAFLPACRDNHIHYTPSTC